jgi:hypothetical protein
MKPVLLLLCGVLIVFGLCYAVQAAGPSENPAVIATMTAASPGCCHSAMKVHKTTAVVKVEKTIKVKVATVKKATHVVAAERSVGKHVRNVLKKLLRIHC